MLKTAHLTKEQGSSAPNNETFIGPRQATSDDFMSQNMSLPQDDERMGTSPKESNIFEAAAENPRRGRRLNSYVATKDYSCLINRRCPSGKTCIISSSG
jgi:hypothetical protein